MDCLHMAQKRDKSCCVLDSVVKNSMSEFLTAVLLMIQFSKDVTPYSLVNSYWCLEGWYCLDIQCQIVNEK
jgi:hypothetical protein